MGVKTIQHLLCLEHCPQLLNTSKKLNGTSIFHKAKLVSLYKRGSLLQQLMSHIYFDGLLSKRMYPRYKSVAITSISMMETLRPNQCLVKWER